MTDLRQHLPRKLGTWRGFIGFCMAACLVVGAPVAQSQEDPTLGSRNRADRLEWFRDQGFGLFIHWSVDSQLGTVISHSLVGASSEYMEHYFHDLPQTFDPTRFDADEWARLARIAGVRYLMFTTKHHSGFTMFRSESTPFGIANTPFKRDITDEVFKAFRKQGIATGVYFSPDDFWWLHAHGKRIARLVPEVQPSRNPGLLAYDTGQLTELLSRYGQIDLAYFDGEAKDLREVAWNLQPNLVVTRGALQTPELSVPSSGLPGAWEASITMGTAWQYQPDNDVYKSGTDLIRLLFQTRAKGGNLLLNVGPKPNGEFAVEQENRLREIGLWMFVNSESIYAVRPWIVPNEGNVWFTQKKHGGPLYAIVDSDTPWERGTWKEMTLHSVRASASTKISVLGQDDETVEYKPDIVPKSTFKQEADGLHLRVMRAQRLQDNNKWPNAVVVKLTDVTPAMTPPHVVTLGDVIATDHNTATLSGELLDTGDTDSLVVGFEYRPIAGEDTNARSAAWIDAGAQMVRNAGKFSLQVHDLAAGKYEYHAYVKHPLLTIYGADKVLR
jgi:alpha-L-fucosidase